MTTNYGSILTISIPWPEKALWINRRAGHNYHLSTAAKDAQMTATSIAVIEAMRDQYDAAGILRPDLERRSLEMVVTTHKINKAPFDLDNLLGALKYAQDGICSMLRVNDAQIDKVTVIRGSVDKRNPHVVIEIGARLAQ